MLHSLLPRIVLVILSLSFPNFLHAASAPPSYEIIDLGALQTTGSVNGINDNGQVVGNNTAPFVYDNGTFTTLTASGGYLGYAVGLNNAGQVAARFTPNGQGGNSFASLYAGGVLTQLGTISGASGTSQSAGINSSGQIVGNSSYPSDNTAKQHAFLYSGGVMHDIDSLGGTYSYALAVNNTGQVAGYVNASGGTYFHAFLFTGGSMTDLGTLTGGLESMAACLNASGQVAGKANSAGDDFPTRSPLHAFLYSGGTMTDLGTLGGNASQAEGINDAGSVVGTSLLAGNTVSHAFLHTGGTMYDLNTLIAAQGNPGNITLTEAVAINSHGWIVGKGTVPTAGSTGGQKNVGQAGNFHAFLAKPRATRALATECLLLLGSQ